MQIVSFWLSLTAVAALLPAAAHSWRGSGGRDGMFWLMLSVAFVGTASWTYVVFLPGWRTGLAAALWITICGTLVVFAVLSAATRDGSRLAPVLYPYLLVLAVIAFTWQNQPEREMTGAAPAGWIDAHIVFSIGTYAILTLAAISGVAAFVQERALKQKRQGKLATLLPGLSSAESLELRLLGIAAALLVFGVLTGIAVEFFENGKLFELTHKTLLSVLALLVVGGLLITRRVSGIRGRQAARLVMLSYLLLTLGYPGVKFVTDILMA
jgi:ABC-type uncharacterized transport system permease subunit